MTKAELIERIQALEIDLAFQARYQELTELMLGTFKSQLHDLQAQIDVLRKNPVVVDVIEIEGPKQGDYLN